MAAIPVDRAIWPANSASSRPPTTGASWRSTRRTPTPPPCPATPTASSPPWATTSSPPARCCELLHDDAAEEDSQHDFGHDILPKLAGKAEIFAYDFQTNRIPGEPADAEPYWRDVGTIDAYYEANMDLRAVTPALNLYNREWPLRTTGYPDPPAKFTFDEDNRRGQAIDTIVSGGCILSGGMVRNSVLGRGVRVHTGALVEDCVILDNCDIGRRAKFAAPSSTRTSSVPEDAVIGYDLAADRRAITSPRAASW